MGAGGEASSAGDPSGIALSEAGAVSADDEASSAWVLESQPASTFETGGLADDETQATEVAERRQAERSQERMAALLTRKEAAQKFPPAAGKPVYFALADGHGAERAP